MCLAKKNECRGQRLEEGICLEMPQQEPLALRVQTGRRKCPFPRARESSTSPHASPTSPEPLAPHAK